tara:strand:+ start:202890 stop:203807 length:918 start_codon:yes stop_codon:yes gene_type:complete
LRERYPQAKVILGAGAEHLACDIEKISGWALCANNLKVTTRIRDPRTFFDALDTLEIVYPDVNFKSAPESRGWLYKLTDSCGGMGVSRTYVDDTSGYWQQEVPGQAVSALCISDGQDVTCLGINQQYSTSDFEGYPYVYQGALANVETNEFIKEKTTSYIAKLINYFNIKGVFSLDMIYSESTTQEALYVLEVNPRISASFELYERINPGLNLVDAHIRVCEGERLCEFELSQTRSAYLIVYAKDDYMISEQLVWPAWVKDKPEALRKISRHEPVCSVYADEEEAGDDLYSLLQRRADEVISLIN